MPIIFQETQSNIMIITNCFIYNKLLRIMKALVEKINALIADFQVNAAAQVEKGNKAAGTRARKAALELSKELKEFRKVSVEEAKK